ncbi:MAG: hypothetical protein M3151_14195 [Actinomycetota bacterium]|nr:hypothetical protein [Actinomycetota bacterium]
MPVTVTTPERSLILGGPDDEPELYDLTRDPGEQENEWSAHGPEGRLLAEQALSFLKGVNTPEEYLAPAAGPSTGGGWSERARKPLLMRSSRGRRRAASRDPARLPVPRNANVQGDAAAACVEDRSPRHREYSSTVGRRSPSRKLQDQAAAGAGIASGPTRSDRMH